MKEKMKKLDLTVLWHLRSNFFCSFFGRIKDTINCFQDLLTFNLTFLMSGNNYLMTTWWLPDDRLTRVWQFPDDFLMTAWMFSINNQGLLNPVTFSNIISEETKIDKNSEAISFCGIQIYCVDNIIIQNHFITTLFRIYKTKI